MRFSQRIGMRPVKDALQIESIDEDLSNRLWNTLLDYFFLRIDNYASLEQETKRGLICTIIWKEFYKFPIDEIPTNRNGNVYISGFIEYVKEWFFKSPWYDVYDFIEHISYIDDRITKIGFAKECNRVLEKEVSGYRIVNEKVVRITSEEEVQTIERAITDTDQFKSVNTHLQTALSELADKKNPNLIK
ncbi:MAG: AbiJ-NTD4 domain-containing protein [Cytophagales bacterium]